MNQIFSKEKQVYFDNIQKTIYENNQLKNDIRKKNVIIEKLCGEFKIISSTKAYELRCNSPNITNNQELHEYIEKIKTPINTDKKNLELKERKLVPSPNHSRDSSPINQRKRSINPPKINPNNDRKPLNKGNTVLSNNKSPIKVVNSPKKSPTKALNSPKKSPTKTVNSPKKSPTKAINSPKRVLQKKK